MVEIKCTIEISASKEIVWDALWNRETFPIRAGVTSLVEKSRPGSFVLFQHVADTMESGASLRDQEWSGGQESYTLKEAGGVTTLSVSSDVPDELEEMIQDRLHQALAVLKHLVEKAAGTKGTR